MFLLTNFLLLCFFSQLSSASDLLTAPKNFTLNGKKYVFVDFKHANHDIVYDVEKKRSLVKSKISFIMPERGRPLFDLVALNVKAKLGKNDRYLDVPIKMVNISGKKHITTYQSVDKEIPKGQYALRIVHEMKRGLKFKEEGVSSRFFMENFKDRAFLEPFLPTNLDFDHYSMSFNVSITGTDREHELVVNCKKKDFGNNRFSIRCPKSYRSSSLFFHVFPRGVYELRSKNYRSINGRIIKVSSYGVEKRNDHLKAIPLLREFENDFGPWPFPSLIINNVNSAFSFGRKGVVIIPNMIISKYFSGYILMTYFSQWIHPVGGNSGWIAEAIQEWQVAGYPSRSYSASYAVNLANQSPYRRKTSSVVNLIGAEVMAHLDYTIQNAGGLMGFLKHWIQKRGLQSVTTETFRKDLEEYSGKDLKEVFNRYIYKK